LQMASQCARDSGDAAGEVSSMYSTPNSSNLHHQYSSSSIPHFSPAHHTEWTGNLKL
jgi:hypothetical protein